MPRKYAIAILLFLALACAKLPERMTSIELEDACFDNVASKEWERAKEYCTWVVRINDDHYGGWGQLCLAQYHLDENQDAFNSCSYAIALGSQDPRIHNAFREIGLALWGPR